MWSYYLLGVGPGIRNIYLLNSLIINFRKLLFLHFHCWKPLKICMPGPFPRILYSLKIGVHKNLRIQPLLELRELILYFINGTALRFYMRSDIDFLKYKLYLETSKPMNELPTIKCKKCIWRTSFSKSKCYARTNSKS